MKLIPENFTKKTAEALSLAQKIAVENNNMQVEPVHLLKALVDDDNGLVPQLFASVGADVQAVSESILGEIEKIPGVTGPGREADRVYISPATDKILNAAGNIADRMKDSFLSVEHIVLAMCEARDAAIDRIFRQHGITSAGLMDALLKVRGNARVTTDSPEDTYDALGKYAQDLVALARAQKLDPVIGRDSEIRNVIRILSRKSKNNPVLIGEPASERQPLPKGSR